MSFFEPPASAVRAKVIKPPAWRRPRYEVLPGIVPVQLIIVRTDQTVVAIAGIRAYPVGFSFTLCLRLHPASALGHREPALPSYWDPRPFEGEPLPDTLLRFGAQFADGRKATNLDRYPFTPEDQEPDRPMLIEGGGEGGGSVWDMEYAVRPLPPPGPLAFVCAWPGRGIAESWAEIDAGLVLQGAACAVPFWPD